MWPQEDERHVLRKAEAVGAYNNGLIVMCSTRVKWRELDTSKREKGTTSN